MEPVMMEVSPEAGAGPPSRRAWILAGAVAAVVFLVFESVSAFVAVPLRELSSILAHGLLSAIGFPVTRLGTILSTPKATFDVVPACSGSTTLQVLLFLSIVWCGVHPRLTPGRRILAILLAIPIALLANAVRVSALVAVGHTIGGAPDDFLHGLTGLAAFALAMTGCFLLTQRLAASSRARGLSDPALRWGLAGLLIFLTLPFVAWCVGGWAGNSPLDRFGFVFPIAAAGIAAWRWMRTPADASSEKAGTICLGASLSGLLAASLIDVNIFKGFSLLMGFLSLSLAFKGRRFALSMIPVALLAYLGFPTVAYQIGVLTAWKLSSPPALIGAKVIVGALLVGALRTRFFHRAHEGFTGRAPRLLPLQVLLAALMAAIQTSLLLGAGSFVQESRLDMSYLQGAWVGSDREPPRSEVEYFGSSRIWSKRFTRDNETVDVLVTSTGGDRHRAHPPAYCVTGVGWDPVSSKTAEFRLGDGSRVSTTLLHLRKEGRDLSFCFWFTNGTESHATYAGMMLHDTLRRLGGRRAGWAVFRVMTTAGEASLAGFLSTFKAGLSPATGESGAR
jgi:exosortase